eukprot:3542728-Karenia_brevis.AAC.1
MGACECDGRWIPAVERLLQIQGIDPAYFKSLVLKALQLGRRKYTNVLIIGEPDGGKSFALKPFSKIFKTFTAMGQKEVHPLQGIHGCEIALLQDI